MPALFPFLGNGTGYHPAVESHVAFTRGNELIANAARRAHIDGEIDFICECDDAECFERVRLSLAGHDRIREEGGAITLPGHPVR
jgi:hypothetical protein